MKTQVEKLENSRVALEIEVDSARVEKALDGAYRRVVKRINIPGFRRGKAPRFIVERRLGRDFLLQEALEDLLPEAYWEAVQQEKLVPVGDPEFNLLEAKEGGPLRFKAEVDVRPEVELGPYKGLRVEKVIRRISDADVQKVLAAYQERHAQLVTTDRDTVEPGDFVVIDFEGYVEGQPFQGGAGRGYTLQVGAGTFLPGFPGFEEQLVGMKLGETREVRGTFSEDFFREDLRGKPAVFKVTLHEIKAKQVPAIDDELARQVGEFETLEEWTADIRRRLEEGAQEEARQRLRNELVKKAAEGATLELPASLVERERLELLEEFAEALARQGFTFEEYLRRTGRTVDELKAELTPRAEERVRGYLVLDAIAKKEGIEVTDEEIEAEIRRMYPGDRDNKELLERFVADAKSRPEVVSRIRSRLTLVKAVDFLEEHAQVEERWVDEIEEAPETAPGASSGGSVAESGKASSKEDGPDQEEGPVREEENRA